VAVLCYGAMAGAVSLAWPGCFVLRGGPARALRHAGVVWVGAGVVLYVAALKQFVRAVRARQLATTGIFAVVRHPLYAAWIWFLFPGLGLFTGSWLVIGVPAVGYAAFRRLIREEEEGLVREFGAEYGAYRAAVPALAPRWRTGSSVGK
jgi:protein-S-isoprenylcysteine O-methyltransferase Ste14